MCVSPCNDACEVISIKIEEGTDMEIKVEEIPETISFPEIKAEPDEVSNVSLCHLYTIVIRLFSGLLSWSAHLNNPSVGNGNFCLVLGYVNS
jgi:hypothetical protein